MQDLDKSVWGHSPRGGRVLKPVTLMCLLRLPEAQSEAQLCLPLSLPLGTQGAVTLGPEHKDSDCGRGSAPESRLW